MIRGKLPDHIEICGGDLIMDRYKLNNKRVNPLVNPEFK